MDLVRDIIVFITVLGNCCSCINVLKIKLSKPYFCANFDKMPQVMSVK